MSRKEVFAPTRPAPPPPRSSRLIGWQEEVDLLCAVEMRITSKKTNKKTQFLLLNSLLRNAGYCASLDVNRTSLIHARMTVQIKAKGNGQQSKIGAKSIRNELRFILNGIHTVDFFLNLLLFVYFCFEAHSHQVLNNSMQGGMKAAALWKLGSALTY